MFALRIASISRSRPHYDTGYRSGSTERFNRSHNFYSDNYTYSSVPDWRKKCLDEMPADTIPEDHDELQPQDLDNGNKVDNAAMYEEIYNELIEEKKLKKAKRRAEREEIKQI